MKRKSEKSHENMIRYMLANGFDLRLKTFSGYERLRSHAQAMKAIDGMEKFSIHVYGAAGSMIGIAYFVVEAGEDHTIRSYTNTPVFKRWFNYWHSCQPTK